MHECLLGKACRLPSPGQWPHCPAFSILLPTPYLSLLVGNGSRYLNGEVLLYSSKVIINLEPGHSLCHYDTQHCLAGPD